MRALTGSSSLLTYEPYYGLREKPFSLSTDPRFLYKSSEHAKTFDDLLLAIRRREGLIVLTGDIGTGKTTLCKAVLEKLDRKTFATFVPDPFITREDLIKRMLIEFGAMSVDDLKDGKMQGASASDLSYPLVDFLKSLVPLQAFAVLIIDETQNLALPLLEEIRVLSDLESPEKLLQVVLVGQLELRAKLKLPEMRQLDQRVSARCSLQALTRDAVSGYIAHRLEVAGGTEDRVHFSAEAIDAIFAASGGVPRVINLICDRALHLGHLQRKNGIELPEVAQAIEHLGVGHLTAAPILNEPPPPAPPGSARCTARARPEWSPSTMRPKRLPMSSSSLRGWRTTKEIACSRFSRLRSTSCRSGGAQPSTAQRNPPSAFIDRSRHTVSPRLFEMNAPCTTRLSTVVLLRLESTGRELPATDSTSLRSELVKGCLR